MEASLAAAAFAALSQGTRLDLLRLLIARGPDGVPAGELSTLLAVHASTLSFHLAALERVGLTQSTRQGRQIIHAARIAGVRRLLEFLSETCGGGTPEPCGDLFRPPPDDTNERRGVTPAYNVLFLCTHNSARSIMAEAILNQVGGARFRAYSAGAEPVTAPNPDVMARLQLFGHATEHFRSKSWHEFTGHNAPRMDFVITLCDPPEGQVCPDFGAAAVATAWPMPDPLKFTGSRGERAAMLNMLYASLRRRLEVFVALPFASLDRMAAQVRLDRLAETGPPLKTDG